MPEVERAALAAFAKEMSEAFDRLAVALGGNQASPSEKPSLYGPATSNLPWAERVLRQSLILHEIQDAGGNVPQTTWYEIAGKYGYSGRGLAGFFRAESKGLLELRKNGRVYVTKHGRDRLAQNKERVAAALAEQEITLAAQAS